MGLDKGGDGMSFVGGLTILLFALKLLGVIGWSWLWVLSPLWISVGIGLSILVLFLIIGAFIIRKTG